MSDKMRLFSLLLQNAAKCCCRNMPHEDICTKKWPYPYFQMKAEVGAKFTNIYSAASRCSNLLEEFGFTSKIDTSGNGSYVLRHNSKDFSAVLKAQKFDIEEFLPRAISSHIDLVTQFGSFPSSCGEYDDIMELFGALHYAKFCTCSETTLREWYDIVYTTAKMVTKENPGILPKKSSDLSVIKKSFDKYFSTTGAKIWCWTDNMRLHFEDIDCEFEREMTGGNYR